MSEKVKRKAIKTKKKTLGKENLCDCMERVLKEKGRRKITKLIEKSGWHRSEMKASETESR